MVYDGWNPSGIDWGNADRTFGQVKFDTQQVVIFYTRSVFNAVKSKAAGSRQYENEVWVKMHPPGEKFNIIDRPVQESDKRRFPQQWNLFLQNKTQIPEGTPIDLLFPNNPAVADNLKAFGVHTIQQCANLSASALETIGMGADKWKNMAVQYIENANSGTAFLQLRAEVDKKDQEIRLLNQTITKLQERLDDINHRISNPNIGLNAQNWADAQEDQINAAHPSQMNKSPGRKKGRASPPKDEVDQVGIIEKVTEESFPVIDVTKEV